MNASLARKAASLPTSAGVYLFRDARGRVLYVGKAINLRSRVRQYIAGTDDRFMVPYLVAQAADVEVVLTHTEKEALLLENILIKKHHPRFNVQLRDDKQFLHLRLDLKEAWPRYTLVRRIRDDGARYFGPYASASRARKTLNLLQRYFPMRTCTDAELKSRKRPCLLYQMNRCIGPCVGFADREHYEEIMEESMLFLQGRHRPLIKRLTERMKRAAEAEGFEEAARLRDLIRSVQATVERQQVVDTKLSDRDIWGLYREGTAGAVAVLPVREGLMGEVRVVPSRAMAGEDEALLSSMVNEAYPSGAEIPPEILLPVLPTDAAALEELLSERKGRKVVLRAPQRGPKAKQVTMAIDNARLRFQQAHSADERRLQALEELTRVLGLAHPPERIECFDNSNIGGKNPVAAMAVFTEGRPDRSAYRRYRVKTVVGADDVGTMKEILTRRLRRGLREGNLPDLLVVDGGRGQLNAALSVLQDLGVHELPVVGLVKPRTDREKGDRRATDRIVRPDVKDPVVLRPHNAALRMLQHIRDEAHAHAVGYHRKVRGKETLSSVLERIPGVGKARSKALLRHLGSARAVMQANPQALATVPGVGPALAQQIHQALHDDR